MQTVLHAFLLDIPTAAGIWLALLLPAIAALTALLLRAGRAPADAESTGTSTEPSAWATGPTVVTATIAGRPPRPRPAAASGRRGWRPRAEAQELSRFAAEVAVAADRSAAIARRRRDQWADAQADAERAWQAFRSADAANGRLAPTTALPPPRMPRTPGEYAERERYLRRAAMAACWRRELSILQLSDALAHRAGWDPRRHPAEQEVHLHRAVRDGAFAAYRSAAAREREAWRIAEEAGAAARSLRGEACAAAVEAWRVQHGPARAGNGAGAGRLIRPALRWQAA